MHEVFISRWFVRWECLILGLSLDIWWFRKTILPFYRCIWGADRPRRVLTILISDCFKGLISALSGHLLDLETHLALLPAIYKVLTGHGECWLDWHSTASRGWSRLSLDIYSTSKIILPFYGYISASTLENRSLRFLQGCLGLEFYTSTSGRQYTAMKRHDTIHGCKIVQREMGSKACIHSMMSLPAM